MALASDATEVGNTALANQEKYAESLSGKLTALKTEVESIWLNLYSSEEVGEIVDAARAVVQKISEMISTDDALGLGLGVAFGTAFVQAIVRNIPILLTNTGVMQSIGKSIATALGGKGITEAAAGSLGVSMAGVGALLAGALVAYIWRGVSRTLKAKAEGVGKVLESATATVEDADTLRDYSKLVEELRTKLADSNTTESEQYDIKSQLYEIQNKLNETYGKQAEGLDLVNGKLSTQLETLKELSREQIKSWKNDVQYTKGGFGQTITTSNETLGREADEYFSSTLTSDSNQVSGFAVRPLFGSAMLASKDAINRLDAVFDTLDGVVGQWDNSFKRYDVTFNGTPTEVADLLPTIIEAVAEVRGKFETGSNDYQLVDSLSVALSDYQTQLTEENDRQAELQEMYHLSEMFDDDAATELYYNYKDALDAYKTALANGENTESAEAEVEKYKAQIEADTNDWHKRIYGGLYDDFVQSSSLYREKLVDEAFDRGGKLHGAVEAIRGSRLNGQQISDIDVESMRQKSPLFDSYFNSIVDYFEELGFADPTQAALDHLIEIGAIVGEISEDTKDIYRYALDTTENTIGGVANIKEATDKIGSIFKDLEDNNTLSADNYSTLLNTFGGENGLPDIDSWMQRISAAKGEVEATEALINEMVAAWINLKNPAGDVAKADAEIINQSLKEIGATYKDLDAMAQATVNETVEERYSGQEKRGFAEQTEEETTALVDLAAQLGLTTAEEKAYYLQKVLSAFTFDTSGDITALQAVCSALGIASEYWTKYYKARQGLAELTEISSLSSYDEKLSRTQTLLSNNDYFGSPDFEDAVLANDGTFKKLSGEELSSLISSISNELEYQQEYANGKLQAEIDKATGVEFKGTSSGSSSGSGSGSGSTADPEAIEWQERRIKYLEKEHNLLTSIYEDEKALYTNRQQALSDAIGWDEEQIKAYTESRNNWYKLYEEGLNGVVGITDTEGKNPITREMIEGIQSGMVEFNAGKYSKDNYDAIKEVLDYYDSYLEADEKILDIEKEISEHQTERYNLEIQKLEQVLALKQSEASILSSKQSLAEATGKLITEDYYKQQIRNSKSQVSTYYDQIDVYEEYLDELEEGSEEYANIEGKIAQCRSAIAQAKVQQAEWNDEIKRIPIKRLDSYLSSLSHIKSLMTNLQNEYEAVGKTLSADQMQTFVNLDREELEAKASQLKEYQKLIGNYEWGSTKYEETASSIQQIKDDISSIVVDMTNWNKQILNLPIDKLTEANEKLSTSIEALTEQEEEYNSVIDGVTSSIDERIDAINKEREATEKYYEEQIEAIQDVIDALEEENELRDKRLAVEQAEYDLNKAQNQRNVAVIGDNGGVQYIADEDAVRDAQDALDEAKYNYKIYLLQKQIEDLEEERDELLEQYDDQIEALEDISEKWEKITSNIQLAKDSLTALNYLGEGWLEKVLSGNDQAIFDKFVAEYKSNDDMLTAAQKMQESNNRISTLLQSYVDDYMAGKISYEEAFANIKTISSYVSTGLGVSDNLQETLNYLKGTDFTNFLKALSDSTQQEANRYDEYLKAVKNNSSYMQNYQLSLDGVNTAIENSIAALKASYEAATQQTTATKTLTRVVAKASNVSVSTSGTSSLGDEYVHHSGINTGYIGTGTSDQKLEALKAMTLTPLKPDEMPALLQAGEIVLNRSQQDTLLSNIRKLNTVNPVVAAAKSGTVVNMTLSNLTFHEIQNGQDFAKYITKNLSSAIAQSI